MDYTTLSLDEVRRGLDAVIRDTETTFGRLSTTQLNWKPDATRWSVAQCFQHLLTGNEMMLRAGQAALNGNRRTVWQRLPLLPALFGRALIRSQSPEATGKYKAPSIARPTASELPADILRRFTDQQRQAVSWMQVLDERQAARQNMASPFIKVITYSVLDGCRLMLAHDRRHFEQARRVMALPDFPS